MVDDSFDLVITHGPWTAFYMSIMMTLLNKRCGLIAFSFNHGNKIFFNGIFLLLAKAIMVRKVDLYVAYSEQERVLYSNMYSIPINKILFSHYSAQKPLTRSLPRYLRKSEKYICTMGRNNRDNNLFIEAAKDIPIKAIIVCKKGQVDQTKINAKNILVRSDISLEESFEILANAMINVVPIKDSSTGAGHMTIVHAMLCGIPQVITRVDTIAEYFIHMKHGLLVEKGNVRDLKKAITYLIENDELRTKFSAQAKAYAEEWFSEKAAYGKLKAIIDHAVEPEITFSENAQTGKASH